MATDLERFIDCMEYGTSLPRPNWEVGVWPQTVERWRDEAAEAIEGFSWNWFVGEDGLDLDRREYIPVNYGLMPPYEPELLEETDRYEVRRNRLGVVTKALKEGSIGGGRMSMDQYLSFPVEKPEDLADVKRRIQPALPERYPPDLDERIADWEDRQVPLVLGTNCAANGFYWRAREFMGTEGLSMAWYDHPSMMHEMMEAYAELVIETSRPVLEKIDVEYFTLNEDLSMKNGPLLGPKTFREFIFPHLKRMVETFKGLGVRYFAVDTDGDPTLLIPQYLEAGIDAIWPIERASEISPREWRKQFGRDLRLWGGVDKRILAKGPEAINEHLREFIPLIEEGGFIPTVDHTVPPDISWDNFRYYMDAKTHLLSGEFEKL